MEQYVGGRLAHLRNRAIYFLIVTLCCLAVLLGIFTPALPARTLRESINLPFGHRVACSPSQNDPEMLQVLAENENQTQNLDAVVIANPVKQQNHITISTYDDSAITISAQDISPTAKRRRIGSSQ